MSAIHSIQMANGPTLVVPIPPELQGKRVEVVVTEVKPEPTDRERLLREKRAALTRKKPELSPEWKQRLADEPNLLANAVLRYDDPFEPACPPEDWEANS